MKKTKAYKGGRKISKTPKLITDPKILDKMSDKEIANMLAANFGLAGIGAKKTGGTVGRKAGKKVGTKQQTMKSGKRVGCGAAMRGYGKAMGKK